MQPAASTVAAGSPILEIRDLAVHFTTSRGVGDWIRRRSAPTVYAVDGVDLALRQGEILGLVGESGCGKSSLARAVLGLGPRTRGEVLLAGRPVPARPDASEQRRIQIVFQDPYSSLNPRLRVGKCLAELLAVHRLVPKPDIAARCRELLEMVGLDPDMVSAYPSQMSGGQRQRVAIARALAVEPEVLIADEPVSALDVSVQATILQLLDDLRQKLDLTVLFISHDMGVVRHICDRIAVMYLGRIVETGPAEELLAHPAHPYSQALISAVPRLGSRVTPRAQPAKDLPSPIDLPSGCRYRSRCPLAQEICASVDPQLTSVGPAGRAAACHFPAAPVPAR